MDTPMLLVLIFAALALLDAAALQWGADTRGAIEDDHQRRLTERI